MTRTQSTTTPQPAAPFPWGGLLVLAGAVFLSVTAEMIPTGLLPEISAGLDVTPSQTGLLVSAFALAVVVSSVPLSFAVARVPRHTLVVCVIVAIALLSIAASFAPTFEVLFGIRILGGMAHGIFWSVIGSYSAWLVPKEQLGRAVSITTAGGTLAFVLGVPLASATGLAFGWRAPFVGIGVLALIGAVLLWFLLPRVERPPRVPRAERAKGFDPSIPAVALVCLICAVTMIGNYTFYTFIVPFLTDMVGVESTQISFLLFVYGAGGAIGILIAGGVFGRRPRLGLLVGLVVTAISILILALFPHQPVLAIGAFALWGVVFGMVPTSMATQLMHVASPRIRDQASAFYSTAFNTGIGGGAIVGAVVLDAAGLGALAWVFLGALALAIALLVASPLVSRLARPGSRAVG
jgi:MFS transporter, DHA1 family, inner membrane transport protein